jgi:hypothetical protein
MTRKKKWSYALYIANAAHERERLHKLHNADRSIANKHQSVSWGHALSMGAVHSQMTLQKLHNANCPR